MADYATTTEVKTAIDLDSSADDALIAVIITAVSRAIDGFCNRPRGFVADSVASARLYSGSGKAFQRIDECTEISTVAVKQSATDSSYSSWDSGDWVAFSGNARFPDFNSTPYDGVMATATGSEYIFTSGLFSTGLRGFPPESDTESKRGVPTVQVTAKWGYATTVPPVVRQACIVETTRIYKRGQSAFADAIASTELSELRFVKDLDPITKNMLVLARLVKPTVPGQRW